MHHLALGLFHWFERMLSFTEVNRSSCEKERDGLLLSKENILGRVYQILECLFDFLNEFQSIDFGSIHKLLREGGGRKGGSAGAKCFCETLVALFSLAGLIA